MTCNICGETCIEPHNFSHKTVPVNDGKHRGQCVCGAFDAAEEHTFENGICTACGAAAPALVEPTPGGSGIIITPEAAGPVFLSGATGSALDIMCREPLWEVGIDYRCGTGHGVGYLLQGHRAASAAVQPERTR